MTIWTPKLNKRRGDIAAQIVEAIAADVARGALAAGARLPTQRDLAEALGVAIGTVTRAYAAAQQRGLITSKVGSGSVVRSTDSAAQHSTDPGPIDLSRNFIRSSLAETSLLEGLAARSDPARTLHLLDEDQTPAGAIPHRDAGAEWMARRGFTVPPERVVMTNGTQHAMFSVLATLAAPGDTVLAEHVTYAGIKPIAAMLRLRLLGLPMDTEGILPDALEKACRAGARILYTTPTLHNPTGITCSDPRRKALIAILARHNVSILEDDVYGFISPGAPVPLSARLPEQSYFVTSTSKSLAPGLRIGWVLAPAVAVPQLAAAVRATVWEANPMMGDLAATLIRSGALRRIVEEKRRTIERRTALAAAILGPDRIRVPGPSPHLWLDLPPWWPSQEFAAACLAANVLIGPAEVFAVDDQPPPRAFRVCLGSIRRDEQLETALRAIASLLEHRPGMFYPT
jgi:DNA-binding transcriptional MocR family regulator